MDDLQEAEALEAALDALGDSPTTQQILDILTPQYRDAGVAAALKRTAGGGGGSTPTIAVHQYTVTAAEVAAEWADGAGFVALYTPVAGDVIMRVGVVLVAAFTNASLAYAGTFRSEGNAGGGIGFDLTNANEAGPVDGWLIANGDCHFYGTVEFSNSPEWALPMVAAQGAGDIGIYVSEIAAGAAPSAGSFLAFFEIGTPAA